MTEEEWVRANVQEIATAVAALGSRRGRLLVAAVCRLAARLIDPVRGPVEGVAAVVEWFADTGKSKAALRRAR